MPDPWAEFHLEDIETENATRYRFVGTSASITDVACVPLWAWVGDRGTSTNGGTDFIQDLAYFG